MVPAPIAAPVKEDGRLRHDPVRLKLFAAVVEVGEDQSVCRVGQRRDLPGFVLPGLEVHRLGRTDAQQDAEHLGVRDPLGELRVEARTTLLDEGEVEARRVGNRLEMGGVD